MKALLFRFIAVLLLSGFFAFAQEGQTQTPPDATVKQVKPEERGTIEGTITALKGGQPLGKADIEMRGQDNKEQVVYAATSDASGHYILENVDPGSYILSVTRNGYIRTSYGSDVSKHNATPITLTTAQHISKVDVKLPAQAVVAGLVMDEGNEPMENVGIQLLWLRYENGKRSIRPVARMATTNDRGEYRLFGIAPGKYWVRASKRGRTMRPAEIRTTKKGQTTYAQIYFPGGLTIAEGSPIHLAAGEELSGIDFHMSKVKSFTISGKLSSGNSEKDQFVELIPYDASGSPSQDGMVTSNVDSEGKFTSRECQPGRFMLMAGSLSDEDQGTARAEVNIVDDDVNVALEFSQNPNLQGSIHSDDPNDVLKPGINIYLSTEGNGPSFGTSSVTKEDGTFSLKSVALWRVRLQLSPMPDGHYIKSIQLGNIQTEDTAIDLTNGAAGELVITLGTKGATIAGTVQDDQQKLVTNGRVVLIPDDHKIESHYRIASPDQNGSFTIKNVPPGSYKIFAFDSAEYGSWLDPEWLKPFESKGESVELKESEKASKPLTVIVTGES